MRLRDKLKAFGTAIRDWFTKHPEAIEITELECPEKRDVRKFISWGENVFLAMKAEGIPRVGDECPTRGVVMSLDASQVSDGLWKITVKYAFPRKASRLFEVYSIGKKPMKFSVILDAKEANDLIENNSRVFLLKEISAKPVPGVPERYLASFVLTPGNGMMKVEYDGLVPFSDSSSDLTESHGFRFNPELKFNKPTCKMTPSETELPPSDEGIGHGVAETETVVPVQDDLTQPDNVRSDLPDGSSDCDSGHVDCH